MRYTVVMERIQTLWGMVAIGLMGIAVSTSLPSNESPISPVAAQCRADGGKAFSPELTPEQICDRFVAALGDRAATIRADLRFMPRGMASARVAHRRGGEWHELPLFEFAVMDRGFTPSDINLLARDVLAGIDSTPAG